MHSSNTRTVLLGSVLIAMAVGAFVGCEVESSSDQGGDLTLTPASIGLKINQTADFTASGGYEYTWSLSEPSWGLLSSTEGATVRYTSRFEPGTNTASIQTLTVVSTIDSNSGGTDSNGVSLVDAGAGRTVSASALIEHFAGTEVDENDDEDDPDLTLSASSTESTNGTNLSFQADGGDGTYAWTLSDSSLGSLSFSGNAAVLDPQNPGLSNSVSGFVSVSSGDQSESLAVEIVGF